MFYEKLQQPVETLFKGRWKLLFRN